jgi:hypothetical protein
MFHHRLCFHFCESIIKSAVYFVVGKSQERGIEASNKSLVVKNGAWGQFVEKLISLIREISGLSSLYFSSLLPRSLRLLLILLLAPLSLSHSLSLSCSKRSRKSKRPLFCLRGARASERASLKEKLFHI